MEGADGHAVGELIDRAHSLLDAYGSGGAPAHVTTAVELLRPLLDQESPPVVVLLSLAHATLLRAALPPEHGGPDARYVLGEVESALGTVAGAARRIGSHAFVTWGEALRTAATHRLRAGDPDGAFEAAWPAVLIGIRLVRGGGAREHVVDGPMDVLVRAREAIVHRDGPRRLADATHRTLVSTDPGLRVPLARALTRHARHLAAYGEVGRALGQAARALVQSRALAAEDPERYGPDLSRAWTHLAELRLDAGAYAAAASAANRAAALSGAAVAGTAAARDLARALTVQAVCLGAHGQGTAAEARAKAARAVRLLTPEEGTSAEEPPGAGGPGEATPAQEPAVALARARAVLARCAADLGDHATALSTVREAVLGLSRTAGADRAAARPLVVELLLAELLVDQADAHRAVHELAEAGACARAALAVVREVGAGSFVRPGGFALLLARVAAHLAPVVSAEDVGPLLELARARRETAESARRDLPEPRLVAAAETDRHLADASARTGDVERAAVLAERGAELCAALPRPGVSARRVLGLCRLAHAEALRRMAERPVAPGKGGSMADDAAGREAQPGEGVPLDVLRGAQLRPYAIRMRDGRAEAVRAADAALVVFDALARDFPDRSTLWLPLLAQAHEEAAGGLRDDDPDAAIERQTRCVELYRAAGEGPQTVRLASALASLGLLLRRRGRWSEALSPAQEGADLLEGAARRSPAAHGVSFALALRNLSDVQAAHWKPAEALATAERAVGAWRSAERSGQADHHSAVLASLADRLLLMERPAEAVVPALRVVELRRSRPGATDVRELAHGLSLLARALVEADRPTEGESYAAEGLALVRIAEGRADERSLLASALAQHAWALGHCGETGAAVDRFEEALEVAPGLELRAMIHQRLGRLLATDGRPAEALAHLTEAVRLLPVIARTRDQDRDRELGLQTLNSVGPDAVSAAIRAGNLPAALRLLDESRGVLTGLQAGHAGDALPASPTGPDLLSAVADAVGTGVFVAVNVSRVGSDALVVGNREGRPLITRVPLDAGFAACALQANRLSEALRDAYDPDATLGSLRRAWRAVEDNLVWLWDRVAKPVLDAVETGYGPAVGPRRVWWCTTGPMSLLPLHAAGPTGRDGGAGGLLDLTVSSVVTEPSDLVAARKAAARPHAAPRTSLVVLVDAPAGAVALEHLGERTRCLAPLLPGPTVLTDDASPVTVLHALGTHDIVHFACHAVGSSDDPSTGHLVLAGPSETARLSVADIQRHPVVGELAVLTACGTGHPYAIAPEESTNLTTAFHRAGFRHVVGTLWPVTDLAESQIAEDLYRNMTGPDGVLDLSGAAFALRDALLRKRGAYPMNPLLWANHVHVGP
ncbi:CHAT domain-containing protein [Streptomyces sp. SP18ES09]|uniref:CHAT domain-containing protein n=1 Tax=Streptomyces sp. SP18ES09 TaxID=3002532 RepID=UPI002E79895C|nr:CHAT domain-containing protein [Streptomyces sp. SP18ES09]MEE1819739.1 CHAT domain-containing protein [Streptomyces sp. SP18ES09]